jgi:hypothetical protein
VFQAFLRLLFFIIQKRHNGRFQMTGPRLFLSYFASSAVAGQSVKHRIPYPKKMYLHLVNTREGVEKQESGRQARRAAKRQAQHIQAYVSIGENRATLNGDLRRSFSTAC